MTVLVPAFLLFALAPVAAFACADRLAARTAAALIAVGCAATAYVSISAMAGGANHQLIDFGSR